MRIVDLPAARHTMAQTMMSWPENDVDNIAETHEQGRMWAAADLMWVTKDMTRVAMDAALDMPVYNMGELIPCDVGFIHYDGGLPALPVVSAPKERDAFGEERFIEVPVDYLLWWRHEEGMYVGHGCLSERLEVAGYYKVKEPYVGSGIVTVPSLHWNIIPEDPYTGHDQDAILKVSILALLAATWSLSQQESVAEKRVTAIEPSKNQRKKGQRSGTVTTVSLRRMRHVNATTDSSGRKLTHRHIVRGHWRQQAHGPGRTQRTATWIPSYVKGPEGAPLIRSEKVMVWRR